MLHVRVSEPVCVLHVCKRVRARVCYTCVSVSEPVCMLHVRVSEPVCVLHVCKSVRAHVHIYTRVSVLTVPLLVLARPFYGWRS